MKKQSQHHVAIKRPVLTGDNGSVSRPAGQLKSILQNNIFDYDHVEWLHPLKRQREPGQTAQETLFSIIKDMETLRAQDKMKYVKLTEANLSIETIIAHNHCSHAYKHALNALFDLADQILEVKGKMKAEDDDENAIRIEEFESLRANRRKVQLCVHPSDRWLGVGCRRGRLIKKTEKEKNK